MTIDDIQILPCVALFGAKTSQCYDHFNYKVKNARVTVDLLPAV